MSLTAGLPVERFLQTLEIVAREGKHLSYSWHSLFSQTIDAEWVRNLEHAPEIAERPGSQIETLNRAERLGIVTSTERWLEARNLRNRLVHEYITDPERFAEDLNLAKEYSPMLLDVFNRSRQDAMTRMGLEEENLPESLPVNLA